MTPSLQVLLAAIVDYAGLFPPAQLPLDQAIRAYARYRHESDSWLLSRFICPAERLADLTPFMQEFFSSGPALLLSTVGRGGKSAAEYLTGLQVDLDAMSAFHVRHGERADVSVYESRVPSEVLAAGSKNAVRAFLDRSAQIIEGTRLPSLTAYYEVARGADWRSSVETFSIALAENDHAANAQGRRRCRRAGFKLRCGGLEASAFPSTEEVALAITQCRAAGVPLKFTAGLHQPLRHYSVEAQTPMHGFLNVFGAGVLAHARQLTQDQVQRILEDDNAEDFAFEDTRFRWKQLDASVSEIKAARQSAVISFGSCSFEEPRDCLRALSLLN